MEDKKHPLMKITCMNQNCLFGYETNHPEMHINKLCPQCGNAELKITRVNTD